VIHQSPAPASRSDSKPDPARIDTSGGRTFTDRRTGGRVPHPSWNLRVAALEYAAAVEVSADDLPSTWDRLRKAAVRYTRARKRSGCPRGSEHRDRKGDE
jgi:hypothetical protein